MERFTTKTIVITGAGSGFGRGLAIRFGKIGWKVAASDINMEQAVETARLVDEAGGTGLAYPCDVTKHDDIQDLAEAVLETWCGLDILVNNAGVPVIGYMEKVAIEDWRFEIDIMLMSVIYGCRTFIPVFKRQGRGHIVNVASAAGIVTLPEMSPYNVTKAGVISLSETLHAELKGSGVGVTVVCPTFFKTNLMEHARVTDARQSRMADSFFNRFAFGTVNSVCRATLKAVSRNKLYVLPQIDAKIYWFLKRMTPQIFGTVKGIMYSTGLMDRILGI